MVEESPQDGGDFHTLDHQLEEQIRPNSCQKKGIYMLSYILVKEDLSLFIHTFGAHLTPLTNRQTESGTSVESLILD